MLVFFFRKRNPALSVRRLKDLRNPHFTALWQPNHKERVAHYNRCVGANVLIGASGRE